MAHARMQPGRGLRTDRELEREQNGTAFLVLELVEGPSLRERLDDGPLPWREALMLGLQIVAALEAAHARGVSHRDLKPANVLVTPDEVVKLIDFGIGRREGDGGDDQAITRQGEMMGTPGYMSPEQVRGQAIDRRTDIFTFGCLVYECLCGKKAFGGATVEARASAILSVEPDWSALPADIPPVVRSLLERCLAKEPGARLQHIAEVRLAMEALMFPTSPGLPQAVFSPVGPAGRPHNLPRRLTSFIGRERALRDVRAALEGSSLLTLTGTGGCGKTRLALRVAEEMLPAFAGGAWLIELAGVTDPQLVESQVAAVLGLGQEGVGQDSGGEDARSRLRRDRIEAERPVPLARGRWSRSDGAPGRRAPEPQPRSASTEIVRFRGVSPPGSPGSGPCGTLSDR